MYIIVINPYLLKKCMIIIQKLLNLACFSIWFRKNVIYLKQTKKKFVVNWIKKFRDIFFFKISLHNSLKIFLVLMTCNHVFEEETLNRKNNWIYIKYSIKIDDSRIVYTNINFHLTIIELRKNEYPDIDSLLEIDEEILKNKQIKDLNETSIYLFHYLNGQYTNFSFGTIKEIEEYTYIIQNTCGTEKCSSGGPLINNINMKLIGIHKGKTNKNFYLGTYIKPNIFLMI